MMTKLESYYDLLGFMDRADLKGSEVPRFLAARALVIEAIENSEKPQE